MGDAFSAVRALRLLTNVALGLAAGVGFGLVLAMAASAVTEVERRPPAAGVQSPVGVQSSEPPGQAVRRD